MYIFFECWWGHEPEHEQNSEFTCKFSSWWWYQSDYSTSGKQKSKHCQCHKTRGRTKRSVISVLIDNYAVMKKTTGLETQTRKENPYILDISGDCSYDVQCCQGPRDPIQLRNSPLIYNIILRNHPSREKFLTSFTACSIFALRAWSDRSAANTVKINLCLSVLFYVFYYLVATDLILCLFQSLCLCFNLYMTHCNTQ